MSPRRRPRPGYAVGLDRGALGQAALARRVEREPGAEPGSERRRYRCECVLDQLSAHGQISDRLWAAGERFRIMYLAQGEPRPSTSNAEAPPAPSVGLIGAELRVAAHASLRAAQERLDPDQWLVVSAVCGEDQHCSGRLAILQAGLAALADHWRIAPTYCRTARR